MPIDEHAALIAERASLYEMLKTVTGDEWDHPTLCGDWRVRDVATHAHLSMTVNPLRLVAGLVVNKGDFNAFMAKYVPSQGDHSPETILAQWAEVSQSSKIPPTTKRVELAIDAFVHHHDIAIPLGKSVATDDDRLRWLADGMVGAKKPIGSGPRVDGLRLIATDIDWHYGTGPEITGPAAMLILAGCGRAVHDQLEGGGVAELARRP